MITNVFTNNFNIILQLSSFVAVCWDGIHICNAMYTNNRLIATIPTRVQVQVMVLCYNFIHIDRTEREDNKRVCILG